MRRVRLGDVCEVVSGSTPKTNVPEYWDGDKEWITPAELSDDSYVINDSVRKITDLGVQETGLKPFPKGTVILSSRAPIGKVAIAGKSMYCNQGFKNLICSEAIIPEYLYWFLKGNTEYLNSLGRGATFKEISKKIVENIEIALPDKERQEHAVAVLVKCWEVMQKRKAELTQLDELIKARFVEMFGHGDYPTATLQDITEVITKGTTPTTAGYTFMEEGINFFKIESIKDDHTINLDKVAHVSEECHMAFKRSQLKEGDILFSIAGAIGRTAIISKEDVPGNTNQALAIIRLSHDSGISNRYLISAFESPLVTEQYNKKKRGVAQINLSLQDIGNLNIPVPTKSAQVEFVQFAVQVDKSKVAVQKSLGEAQLLFDSLMQQYFG